MPVIEISEPVSQRELRLGALSLLCLALGLVGPVFGTYALGLATGRARVGVDPIVSAMGVRGIFVLLALVLGYLGRRSRAGRVGLIGSAALLAIVLVITVFLASRPTVAPVSRPTAPL